MNNDNMITQEELLFIYNNWKINQYVKLFFWGESHENARPEYYLSLYRGAVFTYKEKDICFSHINKNINSKIYNSDSAFIDELCLQWLHFLKYTSTHKYIEDVNFREDYIKNYILKKLQKSIKNISLNERIYNL